jgi:hypothetical protein
MARHNRDAAAKRSGQHGNGTGVQFIFSLFIIHLPASAISPVYRPAAIVHRPASQYPRGFQADCPIR